MTPEYIPGDQVKMPNGNTLRLDKKCKEGWYAWNESTKVPVLVSHGMVYMGHVGAVEGNARKQMDKCYALMDWQKLVTKAERTGDALDIEAAILAEKTYKELGENHG